MDSIEVIDGVILTPLMIIEGPNGSVLRAQRKDEESFKGFGECYFSTVSQGTCKGWKRHLKMTLNLVVPVGEVRFIAFDDRNESSTFGRVGRVDLSLSNYNRLTVPPGVWLAFSGLSTGTNMLLNVADLIHDPLEAESRPLEHPLMPKIILERLIDSDLERVSV